MVQQPTLDHNKKSTGIRMNRVEQCQVFLVCRIKHMYSPC